MGTQKAIAAQIVDSDADYVLALKGNQETLNQAVIEYIDQESENDFADVEVRRHLTTETGSRGPFCSRTPHRFPLIARKTTVIRRSHGRYDCNPNPNSSMAVFSSLFFPVPLFSLNFVP